VLCARRAKVAGSGGSRVVTTIVFDNSCIAFAVLSVCVGSGSIGCCIICDRLGSRRANGSPYLSLAEHRKD
jgi:hypothetical protein